MLKVHQHLQYYNFEEMLINTIKKLLNIPRLFKEHTLLKREVADQTKKLAIYETGWPPGHFYSPIPSLDVIRTNEEKIWGQLTKEIPGIQLKEKYQLMLLQQLSSYYAQQPWTDEQQQGIRYYFNNPNFSYGEAIVFFCLLQQLQPKKVIEIGSGFSSCVLLDTNELFFENSIATTFIEPYPELLHSLLKDSDKKNATIIASDLQNVSLTVYESLNSGDILFIDSTHVSKINSDVNKIFFEILPQLKSGVYIHFHDIYFPFEYPKEWIYQGRAWNEAYLLRAFLQYNNQFEIVFFNSFLGSFHKSLLRQCMPLCDKNPGSSIWLRKI